MALTGTKILRPVALPSKAPSAMVVAVPSMLAAVRAEQPLKALAPMAVMKGSKQTVCSWPCSDFQGWSAALAKSVIAPLPQMVSVFVAAS